MRTLLCHSAAGSAPASSARGSPAARVERARSRAAGPGQRLAAFEATLPGSRGAAYVRQRGIPLALAQQLGVGEKRSGCPAACGGGE